MPFKFLGSQAFYSFLILFASFALDTVHAGYKEDCVTLANVRIMDTQTFGHDYINLKVISTLHMHHAPHDTEHNDKYHTVCDSAYCELFIL